MPILGGAAACVAGNDDFDAQGAATLFWEPVPTVLRAQDWEEQVVELTVRILSAVSRTNHNSRVRRLMVGMKEVCRGAAKSIYLAHALHLSRAADLRKRCPWCC